jgi:YD repeat-containing protein
MTQTVVQSTDAAVAIVNRAYDAIDRIISVIYPADPSETVTYTYDESGYGFSIGNLTTITDATGTLHRTYDEQGNILSETRTIGPATLVTTYAYDPVNRLASVTYLSGLPVAYARGAMGRVTGITAQSPSGEPAIALASGITYQPFGPGSSWTLGNGIADDRTFDQDYRLTGLSDNGTNLLQKLTYAYDAGNNVRSITDGVTSSNNQSLQYDASNRLTNATGAYGALT